MFSRMTISSASSSAFYAEPIASFLGQSSDHIRGVLSGQSPFADSPDQKDAWNSEIAILKKALQGIDGYLCLEFDVPRIGSRIDAVVLSKGCIFVLEFKVGEKAFHREAINQVWDYALDLKNFHLESHRAHIIPILICTLAKQGHQALSKPFSDGVYEPITTNPESLPCVIEEALSLIEAPAIDPEAWIRSPYQPTPTIIEDAQSLYSRHSVEAISRHDAGARNLAITSKRVEELIEQAARNSEKHIIFVTGVPGAGKTLVGLNVATKKREEHQQTHAVFLSGNGPLVAVLREALTRDEVQRLKPLQKKVRKGEVGQKVKSFIQNVHHFRDDGLRDAAPPCNRVVIFDEAQRAWDKAMTSSFMARKKNRPDFNQSEPEFLISYLNRHVDWAVVICLVGGGQEINRGEAGIRGWLDAIQRSFPDWNVHVSPNLTDSEYAAGDSLSHLSGVRTISKDPDLHLSVSMRSFRAENVSAFVKSVLDCETSTAKEQLSLLRDRFPIVITRDLARAKDWIRSKARGSERFGLVASSGAERLRPHAVDVRFEINPIHWFLNGSADVRSSFYMEDPATEFQVQGLELDWVCMTWDADLRLSSSKQWNYHSFRGDRWTNVHKSETRQYLLNAYRVLLTRARQGMAIFVPPGDEADHTRKPAYYDHTFDFLKEIGLEVI
jgi:DNA polymerase III delta prime subunit